MTLKRPSKNQCEIKSYILSTEMVTCEVCGLIPPCPHIEETTLDRVAELNRVLAERIQSLDSSYFEALDEMRVIRNLIRTKLL